MLLNTLPCTRPRTGSSGPKCHSAQVEKVRERGRCKVCWGPVGWWSLSTEGVCVSESQHKWLPMKHPHWSSRWHEPYWVQPLTLVSHWLIQMNQISSLSSTWNLHLLLWIRFLSCIIWPGPSQGWGWETAEKADCHLWALPMGWGKWRSLSHIVLSTPGSQNCVVLVEDQVETS